MLLRRAGDIQHHPLARDEREKPSPGPGQVLIRVEGCGVCRTDLHLAEGEIVPPSLPIVPGHQVVGVVDSLGPEVGGLEAGARVGVAWLGYACGACDACQRGEENLCVNARFTGFHHDGGFAEWLVAEAAFVLPLATRLESLQAAPLLCAGIIGYRSLRKADVQPGETVGLIGFGASAHLALQVLRHWRCPVYVFTRSHAHRELAASLGAAWVGGIEDRTPGALDRAVLFAPAGDLVHPSLERIRPGGTLAINAVHMSPIPEMPYRLVYGERTIRSVSNATRRDGREFLSLAEEIGLRPTVRSYSLEEANLALEDMKHSRIDGAAVLQP
ncbi:MAG TPA: zinc-dependent alcohol dehydrogenase family protein [Anaerolineales bacterium]|nr:zinc-dependent alcohol dehydrogenase family protein [Anaerolineales bacterium]